MTQSFPLSIELPSIFEITYSANLLFKPWKGARESTGPVIQQLTESSRHPLVRFSLMLGMVPSITAARVELVFMSVQPSSIKFGEAESENKMNVQATSAGWRGLCF